jgi:hypothetical protein
MYILTYGFHIPEKNQYYPEEIMENLTSPICPMEFMHDDIM